MTTMLIILLAGWAIASTAFLLSMVCAGDRLKGFDESSQEYLRSCPDEKKLDAYLAIQKQRETHIPWFQKSLSTFGVIAFFSMSAAALTQTISSQINHFKAEAAEQRYVDIKRIAEETERANSRSIKAILALVDAGSPVSREMTDLLYGRLDELGKHGRPPENSTADLKERVRIAMALRNTDCAAQIWQSSGSVPLRDLELNQADVVSFGELYFLLGDALAARKALDSYDVSKSTSLTTSIRAASLEAALTPDPSNLRMATVAQDISSRFNVQTAPLLKQIGTYSDSLARKRAQMMLDSSKDYCVPGTAKH